MFFRMELNKEPSAEIPRKTQTAPISKGLNGALSHSRSPEKAAKEDYYHHTLRLLPTLSLSAALFDFHHKEVHGLRDAG